MQARAFGAAPGSGRFRPEVQALRAVAVALVVLYHLWPRLLPGGYVGVDVFFVISGFLITGQLTREIARTGRVRLLHFWARRVRRLLPAAFAVLVAVALGVWLLVPRTLWQQYFGDIGFSALYVQNWHLIGDAVNYFAAGQGASPLQHFWSLSVEEQFYLVWPALLLVPLLLPVWPRHRRLGTACLLGAVTAASLGYGILLSATSPSIAYLSTATRAWEFGLGGLLAYLLPDVRLNRWIAAALSWAGLAAIVVAAFLFTGATPFPGTAALLPTLGALAVIVAGLPGGRWGGASWMTSPGVQWLGDASYSLYLWHWPLIVLAPLAIERLTGTTHVDGFVAPAILVASLGAAWASRRYVEDTTRHGRFWADARPRRAFAIMAAGMAVVCAVSLAGWAGAQRQIDQAHSRTVSLVESSPRCLGAAAIDKDGSGPCVNGALDGVLVPTVVAARKDLPDTCLVSPTSTKMTVCAAGVPASEATKTVALVGDSHAAQWEPALEQVAKAKKWHIVMMLKGSCAFSTATRIHSHTRKATSCAAWNKDVVRRLDSMTSLGAVITSADIADRFAAGGGQNAFTNAVQGYRSTWGGLPSRIRDVYVIADTPRPEPDILTCLSVHSTAQLLGGSCSRARSSALGADPLVQAAEDAGPRIHLLDLADDFCTVDSCPAVVGHVIVYRDTSHITAAYSTTLGDDLGSALSAAS